MSDTVTENKTKTTTKIKISPPSMWKVIFWNDDYTPMDFVIIVLTDIFNKSEEEAMQLMLKVHNEGKAIIGIYTKEIGETKVNQVASSASAHQYPLVATLEKE